MLFKFMRNELLNLSKTIDDYRLAMCFALTYYYTENNMVSYIVYNDVVININFNKIITLEQIMDHLFNIKEHISSQNYKNMCNGLMKYHKRLCKEIKDRKFALKE